MIRVWRIAVLSLMISGTAAWSLEWVPDKKPEQPSETQPAEQPGQEAVAPEAEAASEADAAKLMPMASPDSPIKWEESLDSALARARKEKKPVMIEFYVTYQQWARILEEKTLSDTGTVELARDFVCVRVDGKQSEDLLKKYNVTGYPTVIFLNSRGEVIQRLVGFMPAAPFQQEMRDLLAGREPAKEFERLEKSNPKDFRSLVLLGIGYARIQQWDKAIEAYEKALAVNPGWEAKETQEVAYALCPLYDYRKTPAKSVNNLLQLLKTESANKIKVHDILGHTYLSLKQPDKAIEQFEAERALVQDEEQVKFLDRLIQQIRNTPKQSTGSSTAKS